MSDRYQVRSLVQFVGEHTPCVAGLVVDGKPLSLKDFEKIPEETYTAFHPLGYVDYHHGKHCNAKRDKNHVHLVWINSQGELRQTIMSKDWLLPRDVLHLVVAI